MTPTGKGLPSSATGAPRRGQETPPGRPFPARHEVEENRCGVHPLADGDRHQPPMPAVLDSAARARRRVLALFLPVAAALYISAEALNPRGTDQPITSRATALRELPIAAHHPAQLYVSGSLTLLALGALAVSYAAIATLLMGFALWRSQSVPR